MRAASKPPPSILIGHAYFTVKFDKHLSENSEAVGLTGPETQYILIDPKLGPDVERETVLHEAMHGIFFQSGLRLQSWHKDKIEEQIIWSMAKGVFELLRSNPELCEYLLEDVR
jgi:hypothetical protein